MSAGVDNREWCGLWQLGKNILCLKALKLSDFKILFGGGKKSLGLDTTERLSISGAKFRKSRFYVIENWRKKLPLKVTVVLPKHWEKGFNMDEWGLGSKCPLESFPLCIPKIHIKTLISNTIFPPVSFLLGRRPGHCWVWLSQPWCFQGRDFHGGPWDAVCCLEREHIMTHFFTLFPQSGIIWWRNHRPVCWDEGLVIGEVLGTERVGPDWGWRHLGEQHECGICKVKAENGEGPWEQPTPKAWTLNELF